MAIGDVLEFNVVIEHLGNGQMEERKSIVHMRRMPNGKVQLFVKHFIITLDESDLMLMLDEILEEIT